METKAMNNRSDGVVAEAGINLSQETLAPVFPQVVEGDDSARLVSGEGSLGNLARMAGIRSGAPFEVVVAKGATGFKEITAETPKIELPSAVDKTADLLRSGEGALGEMAAMNGVPLGAAFNVVTYKGKTGFKVI